jgi:hypothetical protein
METYKKPVFGKISDEEKKLKKTVYDNHYGPLIELLELENASFYPKVAYTPKESIYDEPIVSLFPSELRRAAEGRETIFLNLINFDWDPFNGDKNLYQVPSVPNYEKRYKITSNEKGYMVPISDLIKVEPKPKPKPVQVDQKVLQSLRVTDMEDANFSHLTIRDLASILLRSPQSNKEWLNDIITNSP